MDVPKCINCGKTTWRPVSSLKSPLGPETVDRYICRHCNPKGERPAGTMSWAYLTPDQALRLPYDDTDV